MEDLLKNFGLTEGTCEREVEEVHLADLSRILGRGWRALPSRLGVFQTEQEEKHAFLSQWKDVKGCEATYKALVSALLDIHCSEEAKGVCRMLTASGLPRAKQRKVTHAKDVAGT